MSKRVEITCAVICIVGMVFMFWFVPVAFAAGSSSSSASEGNTDYSVVLGQISEKLDGMPTSAEVAEIKNALSTAVTKEDISGLGEVIEAIAPVDNSKRIDAMNEFFAAIMTLEVYQWVTLLLLVGVLLVLIWLVSYRSHT